MRILVVEDDPASLMLMQRLVETLGHSVITASDGAAAYALFQSEAPDVVLSDWMMPELNGLELCRRVRDTKREKYTYFVLVTALADRRHAAEGMEAGADDYLPKPVDREQLRMRLKVAERVTSLYARLAEQQATLAALNDRLQVESRTDALTRLGNRLRLREDLARLPASVARYGYMYGIMLCDVDFFKKFNDSAGHLAGDEVLRQVAAALAQNCRSGDTAYRYGGEEFLVILPGQNILSATIAAERHRRSIEALQITHPGLPEGSVVTISVGVAALAREGHKDVDTLLSEADTALYQAKDDGRNRVVGFGLPLRSK